MNGVFNLLKPSGMTSHDVVYEIRKKFNIQKVGHTGTLDPNVAGVLPITVGKATKLTQILTDKDKVYRCIMTFGKKTVTSDSYGEIIEINSKINSYEEISNVCNQFIGEIMQKPSMYSAIKLNGQKLYKMARKGILLSEIPERTVKIHSIDISEFKENTVIFDVSCSKGTYIRSLVEDMAHKLDNIAYMSLLIRVKSGQFSIESSKVIDDLSEKDLIPIEQINIDAVKNIVLDENQIYRFINGLRMSVPYIKNFEISEKNIYRVFDKNNNLISIATIENEQLKNILMLNTSI